MPDLDQKGYNNIIKAYRGKYLDLLKELENEYDELLEEFMNRLRRITEEYADEDGEFQKRDLDSLKNELDGLSYWLATETRELIRGYILSSAELGIESHDQATEYVLEKYIEESENQRVNELIERALEGVEEQDAG